MVNVVVSCTSDGRTRTIFFYFEGASNTFYSSAMKKIMIIIIVGEGRRFSIDNIKNDQTIKEAFVVIQPTTCAVFLFTNWFFVQRQHVNRRIYYLRRRVSFKKEAGSFYCCYSTKMKR